MNYQSIILGASSPANFGETNFKKCRFLVGGNKSLTELSIENHEVSSKIIVSLNPEDYDYFQDSSFGSGARYLKISRPTQGALATAGMCLDALTSEDPIIVSAIDGICLNQIARFFHSMQEGNFDGGAIVFSSINPSYCYVRVNGGVPIEFAEKRRIGDLASAGVYYFKNKRFLEESILWAILNQAKVNDQYYFSSAMNKLIFENRRIGLFGIDENNYYRFSTESDAIASRMRLKEV